jgi:hypothetical protein
MVAAQIVEKGLEIAYLGVVVRSSWVLHVTKCTALDAGAPDTLSDEPVGVGSVLVQSPLLDHDTEAVRQGLVQGTTLTLIS